MLFLVSNCVISDVKATVSTGPLVIVDKDVEMIPEPSFSELQESPPVGDPIQFVPSDGAATEDVIVSGTSISGSKLSSPPQGVVVVSQAPAGRLTLWLPEEAKDAEQSENISSEPDDYLTVELQANDVPELKVLTADQEPQNEIRDHDMNLLTLVDLIIHPQLEKASATEDSQMKMWVGGVQLLHTEAQEEADASLPDKTSEEKNHFGKMRDELAQRQADAAVMPGEEPNDARPVIRSKIQFSKGSDGLQTLGYEEEVMQEEDKGVIRRFGMDAVRRKPRQTGLRSTFLDLLR